MRMSKYISMRGRVNCCFGSHKNFCSDGDGQGPSRELSRLSQNRCHIKKT